MQSHSHLRTRAHTPVVRNIIVCVFTQIGNVPFRKYVKTPQNVLIKRLFGEGRPRCREEAKFSLNDIRFGMSMPNGLYYNRGEARRDESTVSEVVLNEVLVAAKNTFCLQLFFYTMNEILCKRSLLTNQG